MPSCDIILPVFNNEHDVLSSVHSVLNQTHGDLRLIVIDDGSSDGTMERLAEIDDERMLLIRNDENLGLPTRLNEGVAMSSAPYVARMDADDIAHPRRLERQIAVLENDKSLDLVGCWVVTIDQNDSLIGCRRFPTDHEDIVARPFRSIPMAHPAWCGRSEWFKANPYNAADIKAQDQTLLVRSRGTSRFANLPDFLLAYRESTALSPMTKLRTRRIFARNIRVIASQEGQPLKGFFGAAGVLARWPLDVLSWVSGNPKMAGHRFQQLGEEDERTWRRIIEDVREAGSR